MGQLRSTGSLLFRALRQVNQCPTQWVIRDHLSMADTVDGRLADADQRPNGLLSQAGLAERFDGS